MARKRREALREATFDDIKVAAHKLMAEHGTAGLSIRAIARELEMTAPALYYYYNSLDDLITALILDAFMAQGDAMEAARDAYDDPLERLMGVMLTFRRWAMSNPVSYMLISGNPIPGYHAPTEITTPAAARNLAITTKVIADAMAAGAIDMPQEASDIPASLRQKLVGVKESQGGQWPVEAIYLAIVGWTKAHGIISLELYHALEPLIGDGDDLYNHQMKHWLGLK